MLDERNWYVAIVAPNTEKVAAERLRREFEIYLPTQTVISVWKDGRRKLRERMVLPGMVLIHCTKRERSKSLEFSFIKRYLVDHAGTPNEFGRHPVAVISDAEIDRLKLVLGQSDSEVTIEPAHFVEGEQVRVISGPLTGLEGHVVSVGGASGAGSSGSCGSGAGAGKAAAGSAGACTGKAAAGAVQRLHISIGALGCASVEINASDLEKCLAAE